MKTRMKNSRRAKKRGRKRVAEATNTPDTFQDTATVPRMSLSREGDRQIIILNHQMGLLATSYIWRSLEQRIRFF